MMPTGQTINPPSMTGAVIEWAPDIPASIASCMKTMGLGNPKWFRLTLGSNNPRAYEEAVGLCSQANGLTGGDVSDN